MKFEDMSWMDVQKYLEKDDRLIFIVGSCEQHGYLSLATDTLIPNALAVAAAQITGVLIAPPLYYGISPYFLTFPGTISLKISTYLSVIEDLVRSVYRQGFRRLLFLNGHGGNDGAATVLHELADQLPDLQSSWISWWQAIEVQEIAKKHGLITSHANWQEAFPFTTVQPLPEGEKPPVPDYSIFKGADAIRQLIGDGSFGGYYKVQPTIMDEIFQAALQEILLLLKFKA